MKILLELIFTLLFIYLLYLVILYLFTKVPIILTNKKYFPVIFSEVPIPKGGIVYELGCGKADFLFSAEKYGPQKLIGYEMSPLHAAFANIKARMIGSKVEVHWQDFFKADISEADYIYLFLVQKISDKAWLKIAREAKKGAIVLYLSDIITKEKPFKVFKTQPHKKRSSLIYTYRVE